MVVRRVYNGKRPSESTFMNIKVSNGPRMNMKRPINPLAEIGGYTRGDSDAGSEGSA